jgi:hypothetical protein
MFVPHLGHIGNKSAENGKKGGKGEILKDDRLESVRSIKISLHIDPEN